MAFAAQRPTIGTSASALVTSPDASGTDNPGVGYRVVVTNRSTTQTSVYLGGPGVTTANGYEWRVEDGRRLELDLFPGDVLYAIVSSGSQDFHVLTQDK